MESDYLYKNCIKIEATAVEDVNKTFLGNFRKEFRKKSKFVALEQTESQRLG